jgi:CRP-like cAMP-binding protein
MNITSGSDAATIIRDFETIFKISEDEKAAINNLPMQLSDIRADQDIVRGRPSRCFAVLEGFASTSKVMVEGKRQIVAFHVPGDVRDVQSLHLDVLDITMSTLPPCKIGFVQHEAMRALCAGSPRIADALWRDTLISSAIFREWVMNVGRRDAYARMAHILCEWIVRMKAAGLAKDHACELPITQSELADATGMTTVHVNRTLMDLRKDGLIELKGSKRRLFRATSP